MPQTKARRVLAAAALVSTLALARPAEAAGWPKDLPDLFQRMWHWVVTWVAPPEATPVISKDGGCIDPNGRPRPCPSQITPPGCGAGGCLDTGR